MKREPQPRSGAAVTGGPVRAVLLDAVGTLIRPCPPAHEVYWQAGRRRGLQLTREQVGRRLAAALRQAQPTTLDPPPTSPALQREFWRDMVRAALCGPDALDEELLDELFEELWGHFACGRHWALFDDVAPMWRELSRRGLRLGVASNFDQRLLSVCRQLPPLDSCRHVYCSDRLRATKPSRQFYDYIARDLQLPAGQLLMVGDDPLQDVDGAQAAGWRTIRLDRNGGADDAIASLNELPARIGRPQE